MARKTLKSQELRVEYWKAKYRALRARRELEMTLGEHSSYINVTREEEDEARAARKRARRALKVAAAALEEAGIEP